MKKLIQIIILAVTANIAFAQSYEITPNSLSSINSNSSIPITIGMQSNIFGYLYFRYWNSVVTGIFCIHATSGIVNPVVGDFVFVVIRKPQIDL